MKRAVENTICGMTDWMDGVPILWRVWFRAHHNRLYWWAAE